MSPIKSAGEIVVIIGVVILIVLFALLVGPAIMLWSVNTLAEQASVKFYIPHNFWTYLACFGLFLTLKGSTTSKS